MKKWIRKKLNRSGKEKCPICLNNEILVEHHIHGRKIDDAEASWNKAYICDNCHRKLHEGIIVLEDWVSTTEGLKLAWHLREEKGLTGKEAIVYTY